ncbi:MAG: hypothetical protein AAFY38_09030 [Pseudomonadota bacterium]
MTTSSFSDELRDFRLEYDLNRAEFSALLGVSSFTLRGWENGNQKPQSATLWQTIDRLKNLSSSERNLYSYVSFSRLSEIIETSARQVDSSPALALQTRILRVERKLTNTVLKAAGADFQYVPERRHIAKVAFAGDLALFQAMDGQVVREMIENLKESSRYLSNCLEGSNLEQRYVKDSLNSYSRHLRGEAPNSIFLGRKAELIQFALENEGIEHAIDAYLLMQLRTFLEDHNEFMRKLFGNSFSQDNNLDPSKVRDEIVKFGASALSDVESQLNQLLKPTKQHAGTITEEVFSIFSDIAKEARDLEAMLNSSNTPTQRRLRSAQLKVTLFHGALMLGRFVFQAILAVLHHSSDEKDKAKLTNIQRVIEDSENASLRRTYTRLADVISDLPKLPPY